MKGEKLSSGHVAYEVRNAHKTFSLLDLDEEFNAVAKMNQESELRQELKQEEW